MELRMTVYIQGKVRGKDQNLDARMQASDEQKHKTSNETDLIL